MNLQIEICEISRIYPLYRQLPEFVSYQPQAELESRAGAGALALVCVCEGVDAGFKLGYPLNEKEFYSWIGGVLPEYRRKGLALELLRFQEDWVRKTGYRQIRVKSMNRYPAMLSMLIAQAYRIDGFSDGGSAMQHKIHFVKDLQG